MSDGNGALPEGWEPVKVGDIVKFNYGKALSAKQRDHEGFPVYGSNGVIGQHSEPLLEGPALLVGRKGSIGEVHYCDGPCSAIDTTYFVDEFYGQPIRYWYYRLKSLPLAELNRATALPGLNRQDAYDLNIALPPLAEQRRIVSKIESLQERSSRARRALSEVGPLLEQFRQSVLRAAFSGRLTADWRAAHRDVEPATELLSRIRTERRHRWEQSELAKYEAKGQQPPKNWQDKYKEPSSIDEAQSEELPLLPDGWCWATVEEISSHVVDCPHSTPKWTESGKLCIRTTEFRPGALDLTNARYVSEETFADRIKRLKPEPGDVVYSREGGILGIACQVPEGAELCLGQRMMMMRTDPQVDAALLMHWLNSPVIDYRVKRQTQGAASPHLNVGEVKRFPVPIAPRLEQDEIRVALEEMLSSIATSGVGVAESESALTQLDQSILAKAFRGELVPQDPRDEPASELLARIRTTRDHTEKQMPGKRRRKSLS